MMGDIQNTYLNNPMHGKVYLIAGIEWESNKDEYVVIAMSFYCLKVRY